LGKPEEKRPLGRSRRRWEDNIRMEIKEVGCGARTASSSLRRGALLNVVLNLRVA